MGLENDGAGRLELAAMRHDSLSECLHRANAEIARLTRERDDALDKVVAVTDDLWRDVDIRVIDQRIGMGVSGMGAMDCREAILSRAHAVERGD